MIVIRIIVTTGVERGVRRAVVRRMFILSMVLIIRGGRVEGIKQVLSEEHWRSVVRSGGTGGG